MCFLSFINACVSQSNSFLKQDCKNNIILIQPSFNLEKFPTKNDCFVAFFPTKDKCFTSAPDKSSKPYNRAVLRYILQWFPVGWSFLRYCLDKWNPFAGTRMFLFLQQDTRTLLQRNNPNR